MWGFGLFIHPLEAEFGWSRTQVTLGFSLSLLISGLSSPLVGRAIDAHGPRRVMLVGVLLTPATYFLLATTANLWQWFLYLTANAIFRHMITFIPLQALISRWFDRRRGMALGVLMAGAIGGGLVMVPILRVVIDEVNWSGGFVFIGIVIAVLFLPFGLFIVRDKPAENTSPTSNAEISTGPKTSHKANTLEGILTRDAMRTPLFWLYAIAMALFFYGFVGWQVHAVPYYESVGVSPGWAATLISIGAAGAILGRVTFGIMADRIRVLEAVGAILVLVFLGGMVVLLLSDGSMVGIGVFVVCFAIGSGGGPLLEPLLLTRAFGVANFATIFGVVYVVDTVGIVVSPTVAGAIFDSTGSYDFMLIELIAAFALSSLVLAIAMRVPKPSYRLGHLQSPLDDDA
jgi:sugar phosphate permease